MPNIDSNLPTLIRILKNIKHNCDFHAKASYEGMIYKLGD